MLTHRACLGHLYFDLWPLTRHDFVTVAFIATSTKFVEQLAHCETEPPLILSRTIPCTALPHKTDTIEVALWNCHTLAEAIVPKSWAFRRDQ